MCWSTKEIFAVSLIISLLTFSNNDYSAQSRLSLELRTEIRAPDKWEMIWDIATPDVKLVSSYMEHYRKNSYRELQKEYKLYCNCSEVWAKMTEERDLPPSAAYIPLKLNYSTKPCSEAAQLFDVMMGFSLKSSDHISDLRNIYGQKEGFNAFLYDLRVFVRLIENHDLSPLLIKAGKDGGTEHKIISGETLYSISVTYRVSVSQIQEANSMGTSTDIDAGQKLNIPISK